MVEAAYAQQTTVLCFPHSEPLWTGSCKYNVFTENSKIYIYGGDNLVNSLDSTFCDQRGFAKFDISAIPISARITDVRLHFYNVNSLSVPYFLVTRLNNDPVATNAQDLYNEIGISFNSSWNIPGQVVVDSMGISLNIRALLAGDVNGSYNPPVSK